MADAGAAAADSPEVVQFETIEGSKENIQPSRTGYNPHKLLHSLTAQQTSTSEALLASQRHALEQAILEYQGADPLLPWLRYIDWTVASYPALSPCSSLLPLLEKATRTFLSTSQYTNDRRYVRVWLLYADRCPQPADIFAFMHAHAIGRTVAAFYVAWARYNEAASRCQQAEDTLQLGLTSSAQPRNTLDIALRQLRARNEVRVRREVELMAAQQLDPLSDVVLNAMSDTQPRRVLSQVQQQDKENGAAQLPSASAAQPLSAYRRPVAAATHSVIRPVSTTQTPIQIYTDATATAATSAGHGAPLPPHLTAAAQTAPHWRSLPTRAAADKENVLGSSTWNEPLRQPAHGPLDAARLSQQPARPKYAVWADEECAKREREKEGQREEAERVERARREKAAGMRRRMEAGSGAQATPHSKLTADPLRNINRAAHTAPPPQTAHAAAMVPTVVKPSQTQRPPTQSRAALSGLAVSLNATARPAPLAAGGSVLNARLQAHRSLVAPRR
ncbi:hypothetical protein MMC34_008776 [Xylographa carneopallida]|nr:hypothetical protein [Xylographa carneopallida]